MTCLFSSIKEIFTGQPLISFQGGACKAIKSVFIDPYTRLPDSNISYYCTTCQRAFYAPRVEAGGALGCKDTHWGRGASLFCTISQMRNLRGVP